MKDVGKTLEYVFAGIIGIAIVAVLVSNNSTTSNLVQSISTALSSILGSVVTPIAATTASTASPTAAATAATSAIAQPVPGNTSSTPGVSP